MGWSRASMIFIADLAVRGELRSLDSLAITQIEDETTQGQQALKRLLENLTPLGRLDLSGYFGNEVVDCILPRHGRTLRSLELFPHRAMYPEGNEASANPPAIFNKTVVQRLVELCPNLGELVLSVPRTQGDDEETGMYRALGRLPRLRRVHLRLCFYAGPPDDTSNESDADDDVPHSGYFAFRSGISRPFLREAFINADVDATLALAIFDALSSNNGNLCYLRLETIRKASRNESGLVISSFDLVLRWFSRQWVCKRDADGGGVTAWELDKRETAQAGEKWQALVEDPQYDEEDTFQELFKEIWPQETLVPEWWRNWKSFPLSTGSA